MDAEARLFRAIAQTLGFPALRVLASCGLALGLTLLFGHGWPLVIPLVWVGIEGCYLLDNLAERSRRIEDASEREGARR